MKKVIILIGVLTALFFQTAFAFTLINRVVAIVNDDVITQAQVNKKIVVMKAQMGRSKLSIPSDAVLEHQVLDQMIDQLLQVQIAEKNGIRISNSELTAQVAMIAKKNGITSDELYDSVVKDGWNVEDFRKEVREELLVKKLQERDVVSRISLTPQEVDNVLAVSMSHSTMMPEYHLQRILISLPSAPSPEEISAAQDEAESVMKQLRNGADFGKIAASKSIGKHALQGGDLGWVELASLPMDLAKAVKKMKKGELLGPAQTPNGILILKLLDQRVAPVGGTVDQGNLEIIYLSRSAKALDQKAIDQLNDIRQQAQSGVSFSSLAKRYSDAKSAKSGGRVGWVKPGQYGAGVDAAIHRLQVGEISEPIATEQGYYLIKVLAKRLAPKNSAAQRSQVEQMIFERKVQEGIENFISTLRGNSYIKIMN